MHFQAKMFTCLFCVNKRINDTHMQLNYTFPTETGVHLTQSGRYNNLSPKKASHCTGICHNEYGRCWAFEAVPVNMNLQVNGTSMFQGTNLKVFPFDMLFKKKTTNTQRVQDQYMFNGQKTTSHLAQKHTPNTHYCLQIRGMHNTKQT